MDASLRTLCDEIAHEAGSFAFRSRRQLGPGVRAAHATKSSAVDPVTEFDRLAEAMVVDRLRRERPDDSIVGEEGANHTGTSAYEWHIDPIDGTVNFVYDLPGWCTSIAVLRDGHPVAGAVYAPVVDELYSAALGGGTTINGVAVNVSGSTDLATSLAATGFSYHLDGHRQVQAARIARVPPTVRDIRARAVLHSTWRTWLAVASTCTSRSSSSPGTSRPAFFSSPKLAELSLRSTAQTSM